MPFELDPCLLAPRSQVENETRFGVTIVATLEALWDHFARDCADQVRQRGRLVLVFPVGPFDYKRLAAIANAENISFAETVIVNMDEFCDASGAWIDYDHPLSFRAFMDREFFHRLNPSLRPKPGNAFFPDPVDPEAATRRIEAEGGVDICYGGIGLDGHWAFNVPADMDTEEYAALPTRVLTLTPETRCQTAFGSCQGDIETVPPKAITIGMKECLAARSVRCYCMRMWQSSLMRRCLYGPVTAKYPASLLQRHPDLKVVMVDYVADPPRIGPG